MRRTFYSNNFDDFTGAGFAPEPAAGQLDSDLWTVSGFSSESDLARGVTDGSVGTGGIYAIDRGENNFGLFIQPGGSDFTPGSLTLALDSGATDLSDVQVSFERLLINDKDRANSFDFSYSLDGTTYVTLDTFISAEAADAGGLTAETVTVTLPDLGANTELFVRWTGDDVSGGGARDEFGIDSIVIDGFEGEPEPATIKINEVLVSTSGPDSEYIELFGTPGASLAGLSFIGVESDDIEGNGTIDFRYDFADGDVLGDNGFLLLANQTAQATYGVTANLELTDSLENSSTVFALVETGSLDGGAVTGAEIILDAVGISDGDFTTTLADIPVVGPDGPFLPAGVGRVVDGVDTDSAEDFSILNFGNDATVNTPTAGTGLNGGGGGGGETVTIDSDATLVSAVQGAGDASPIINQTVVIEAVVSADFQNGDADTFRDLGGFFVMEETSDRDGDAATSEGVFIFEGGDLLVDVSAGQTVRVLGTVIERFGKTAIEATEIRIEEMPEVDPLSLAVVTSLPDAEDREALEGMLVTIDEPLTFSESFDYESFGDATLSTDGPIYQYSQLNTPDVAGNAAYLEEVADRTITISGGSTGRRSDFDPILEPDGDVVGGPVGGLRMGQSVDSLTAIVDFDFGEYRLRLPEDVFFDLDDSTNPVPTEPEDVGSAYKVASLNVLNYFTTIEGLTDNGNNPRGADDLEELARQTDKLVETILGLDSDVVGLIEIENDFAGESFAIQTLVQELNMEAGEGVWAFVDPGQEFVGDDAIAVAFIYDTTTTALVGDAAILDTAEFLDPLGDATSGDSYNRAALAQTFEAIESGGIYTASVNHFKSKGSLTGAEADVAIGDGAGNNNATRTEASRLLAEWLETDPTNSGDDDVIILGDLNSYGRETPITTLEDAGYTDLARSFEGDDVYSYRFSGSIGTLDYALANESLTAQVTGATTWNVNSDTPVFFDYNLDNTFGFPNILRPTDQGLFDGDSPLRGSDHDPVIVGLALEDDTPALLVSGTSGNDRLNGTEADEIINGGGGRLDVVYGNGGSDTFVFADTDGRRDQLRIMDFDTATDTLDLNGAQIANTRELGNYLRITLDEDRDVIYLRGVETIEDVMIIGDDILLA